MRARRWLESRSTGPEPEARTTAGAGRSPSGRVRVPVSGCGPGTSSGNSRTSGGRVQDGSQRGGVVGADEQGVVALPVQADPDGGLALSYGDERPLPATPPGADLSDT